MNIACFKRAQHSLFTEGNIFIAVKSNQTLLEKKSLNRNFFLFFYWCKCNQILHFLKAFFLPEATYSVDTLNLVTPVDL